MVVFEMVHGPAETHDPNRTDAFAQPLSVAPFELAVAMDAGRSDRTRHAVGVALSPRDAIIEAGATEANATLVRRHRAFAAVGGADVVSFEAA